MDPGQSDLTMPLNPIPISVWQTVDFLHDCGLTKEVSINSSNEADRLTYPIICSQLSWIVKATGMI